MDAGAKLDNRLIRALREGTGVLPGDLEQLCGYLRLINGLLAEKANELEPSWAMACASAAEIETLQGLQATVAERAIAVRSASLEAVQAKLKVWRELGAGAEDGDVRSPRNRLILSIEADVERLLSSGPRR